MINKFLRSLICNFVLFYYTAKKIFSLNFHLGSILLIIKNYEKINKFEFFGFFFLKKQILNCRIYYYFLDYMQKLDYMQYTIRLNFFIGF